MRHRRTHLITPNEDNPKHNVPHPKPKQLWSLLLLRKVNGRKGPSDHFIKQEATDNPFVRIVQNVIKYIYFGNSTRLFKIS